MNSTMWERAACLYGDTRKAGTTIDDADLIIAAYCLIRGYTLVTDNTRHFEQIRGLQIVNWIER